MNYYTASSYIERYFVRFKDLKGGDWRVSIQEPNFSGTATELTPAANPLKWFGCGDEDQTKCLMGSTGYLRLISHDGETSAEPIFVEGKVRPSEVNDRRVIVTRTVGQGASQLVWQGFLKQEEYSQKMNEVASEVELPIMSMIEAADSFRLIDIKLYEDGVTSQPTLRGGNTIGGVLKWCLDWLGGEFDNIVTNRPIYYDYNGQTHTTGESLEANHWTQGRCFLTYFYEYGEQHITPMTVKDVLETIFYPYGKLYEFGRDFVAWLQSPGMLSSTELFKIEVNSASNKFNEYQPVDAIGKVDIGNVVPMSTGVTKSVKSAPSQVTYNIDVKKNDVCFEPKASWLNLESEELAWQNDGNFFRNQGRNIIYTGINCLQSKLDCDYIKNLSLEHGVKLLHCGECDKPSVPAGEAETATIDMPSYNTTSELGFYMYNNQNPVEGETSMQCSFDLTVKPRAIKDKSRIVLSFHYAKLYDEGVKSSHMNNTLITVQCNNKYLKVDDEGYGSSWVENETHIPFSSLVFDVAKGHTITYIDTSEFGTMNAYTMHFTLAFNFFSENPGKSFGLVMGMNFEKSQKYTWKNILIATADGMQFNQKRLNVGGPGDAIDITFKTMASKFFTNESCNDDLPNNGFCDARTMEFIDEGNYMSIIDTGSRVVYDYEEVEISGDAMKLVMKPCYVGTIVNGVFDSTKPVYIPVATGMNARECTTKLKLISSNR